MTQLTRKKADWKRTFLTALTEQGNVRSACLVAGVTRQAAYKQRSQNADFAKAWDDALDDACDTLEQVAWQRATETSDVLLMFLLKAHRPDKYRENSRVEHAGEAKLRVEYVNNWRGGNDGDDREGGAE